MGQGLKILLSGLLLIVGIQSWSANCKCKDFYYLKDLEEKQEKLRQWEVSQEAALFKQLKNNMDFRLGGNKKRKREIDKQLEDVPSDDDANKKEKIG